MLSLVHLIPDVQPPSTAYCITEPLRSTPPAQVSSPSTPYITPSHLAARLPLHQPQCQALATAQLDTCFLWQQVPNAAFTSVKGTRSFTPRLRSCHELPACPWCGVALSSGTEASAPQSSHNCQVPFYPFNGQAKPWRKVRTGASAAGAASSATIIDATHKSSQVKSSQVYHALAAFSNSY